MALPFGTPLLDLQHVQAFSEENNLPPVPLTIRVMPGECIVIDSQDVIYATAFADLCSGIITPKEGEIHFMGQRWSDLAQLEANALRGLIGRLTVRPSWPEFMPTYFILVLQQLHHTTVPFARLIDQASELCELFGLPGLPTQKPLELSRNDLRRASCARAFMGQPQLIFLEYPLDGNIEGLSEPLLTAITQALNRGASVIWFSRNSRHWLKYHQGVTAAWHLGDDGFTAVRMG